MKKIVFFSDWKKMYKHPTPQCEPFVEVPFSERESHKDADAYVQINIQHPRHVKEPFREPFYNYITDTRKPKIVFESAVFRQNVNDNFYEKYFGLGGIVFFGIKQTSDPLIMVLIDGTVFKKNTTLR